MTSTEFAILHTSDLLSALRHFCGWVDGNRLGVGREVVVRGVVDFFLSACC
jgi:hypothetical protein